MILLSPDGEPAWGLVRYILWIERARGLVMAFRTPTVSAIVGFICGPVGALVGPPSGASPSGDPEHSVRAEPTNQSTRTPPLQTEASRPPLRYGFLVLLLMFSVLLGLFIWSRFSDGDPGKQTSEMGSGEVSSPEPVSRSDVHSSEVAEANEPDPYAEAILTLQRHLDQLGYDVGPADGVVGPRTRAAIEEYERKNGSVSLLYLYGT